MKTREKERGKGIRMYEKKAAARVSGERIKIMKKGTTFSKMPPKNKDGGRRKERASALEIRKGAKCILGGGYSPTDA